MDGHKLNAFSLKNACQVGIQLLKILEKVHALGFVYNDLRLENIHVGSTKSEAKTQIKLSDFSLATSYLDEAGHHVAEDLRDTFIGNMSLGSVNAMKFKTPSRRDDFISLCYLLVLMV